MIYKRCNVQGSEVGVEALSEGVFRQEVTHHTDDRSTCQQGCGQGKMNTHTESVQKQIFLEITTSTGSLFKPLYTTETLKSCACVFTDETL